MPPVPVRWPERPPSGARRAAAQRRGRVRRRGRARRVPQAPASQLRRVRRGALVRAGDDRPRALRGRRHARRRVDLRGPVVSRRARSPLQAAGGARLVVNVNASPYSIGREADRLAVARQRVAEAGCAIAYVNQVGGQDELVFDGGSFVMDATGDGRGRRRRDSSRRRSSSTSPSPSGTGRDATLPVVVGEQRARATPAAGRRRRRRPPLDEEAEVYEALVLGTRDYLRKNGFTDAVIGLSGGVDSSLVAAVAVDALGAEHVHGLSMPSRYSSAGSVTDAAALARATSASTSQPSPSKRRTRAFASVLAAALGEAPVGPHRREPPVPDPWCRAHGGVQRPGMDRPHHRQQERAGHRVLDVVRRFGRWLRRDQGRPQDPRLPAVPVPQRPRRAPSSSPSRCSPRRRRPSCAPISATTRACRPTRSSIRCSRRSCSTTGRSPMSSAAGTTPSSWPGWRRWWTGPSTSAGSPRPVSASRPRRSARIGACRSRTATGTRHPRRRRHRAGRTGGR